EIDGLLGVGVALAHAKRQREIGHGQLFISHPRCHLDDFVVMRENVTRRFDGVVKTIENRAADGFWPVHDIGRSGTLREARSGQIEISGRKPRSGKLSPKWLKEASPLLPELTFR